MIDNALCLLVTATMSAGKSTLINALIGKKIVRTSQEVCTGNLCYIYNQSVENNKILLWENPIKKGLPFGRQSFFFYSPIII